MTIIIPAISLDVAKRRARLVELPDGAWVWVDPAFADAYAARCVAFGVDARVLTTPPAARTVVVTRGARAA